MGVVCQVCNGKRLDDEFEEKVSRAELVSRIRREGSRMIRKKVLQFLQNIRPDSEDCCQHLFLLRSCKDAVD